MKRSW